LVSGDIEVKKEEEGTHADTGNSDQSDPEHGAYNDGTELRSRLAKLA
jgi:hypothetical protein